MTTNYTPQVSSDGRVFNLNELGMDPIPFRITGEDVSGLDLRFVVKVNNEVVLNVPLVSDPDEITGLRISLTVQQIAMIPPRGGRFYLIDGAGGAPLHDGEVFRT